MLRLVGIDAVYSWQPMKFQKDSLLALMLRLVGIDAVCNVQESQMAYMVPVTKKGKSFL